MLWGMPSSWMAAFYPGTEMFIEKGEGCHLIDVDGNRFLDMSPCELSTCRCLLYFGRSSASSESIY